MVPARVVSNGDGRQPHPRSVGLFRWLIAGIAAGDTAVSNIRGLARERSELGAHQPLGLGVLKASVSVAGEFLLVYFLVWWLFLRMLRAQRRQWAHGVLVFVVLALVVWTDVWLGDLMAVLVGRR